MTSFTSLFLFEKDSYPGMLDLKKEKKKNDLITDYLIEHFQ